jgi:hypothetical protein
MCVCVCVCVCVSTYAVSHMAYAVCCTRMLTYADVDVCGVSYGVCGVLYIILLL